MSHQDDTIPIDPSERRRREAESALNTPDFDARSVRHARAAVPLESGDSRWDGKLPWIVVAVIAGMIGGLLGIWTLSYYAGSNERAGPQPAASPAAQPPAAETEAAARTQTPAPNDQAQGAPTPAPDAPPDDAAPAEAGPASAGEEAELRGALNAWIDATNARDLERQMSLYDSRVDTFYLTRNATRQAVRAEKAATFSRATKVDVRAGTPQVSLSPDGRTATMRFRKQFAIEGGGAERRGAVLQELRWRRTPQGWKIVGERDLRIVD